MFIIIKFCILSRKIYIYIYITICQINNIIYYDCQINNIIYYNCQINKESVSIDRFKTSSRIDD